MNQQRDGNSVTIREVAGLPPTDKKLRELADTLSTELLEETAEIERGVDLDGSRGLRVEKIREKLAQIYRLDEELEFSGMEVESLFEKGFSLKQRPLVELREELFDKVPGLAEKPAGDQAVAALRFYGHSSSALSLSSLLLRDSSPIEQIATVDALVRFGSARLNAQAFSFIKSPSQQKRLLKAIEDAGDPKLLLSALRQTDSADVKAAIVESLARTGDSFQLLNTLELADPKQHRSIVKAMISPTRLDSIELVCVNLAIEKVSDEASRLMLIEFIRDSGNSTYAGSALRVDMPAELQEELLQIVLEKEDTYAAKVALRFDLPHNIREKLQKLCG